MLFRSEKAILVHYEGVAISGQRVDLIVDERVVVELKAVQRLDRIHYSQVVSYLRTMRLRAGLLINFHETLLHRGIRRVVL